MSGDPGRVMTMTAGAQYPPPTSPLYLQAGYIRSGWWRKVGGAFLDRVIIGIPVTIGMTICLALFSIGHTLSADASTTITLSFTSLGLIADGVYCTLMQSRGRCQTVGNRAAGIVPRVHDTGELPSTRTAFLRWFVRASMYVLIVPGLLNDLWPLWNKRKQSLADRIAGTVMVEQL